MADHKDKFVVYKIILLWIAVFGTLFIGKFPWLE